MNIDSGRRHERKWHSKDLNVGLCMWQKLTLKDKHTHACAETNTTKQTKLKKKCNKIIGSSNT